jgi:hypothetical protein
MKNRIDQLFKEKIENHSRPVPTQAWTKIEAALPKKNNIIVWWRLAAVFLLFGMLVSAIYWLQSNDKENTQPVLAGKKIDSPSQPVEEKAKDVSITRADVKQKEKPIAKISKTEIQRIQVAEDKTSLEVIPETKEIIAETIVQPVISETMAAAKTEKPIVLEFTLEPIEAHVVARAEEKNSGLKRVWEKAKEFKNGEGTFDLQNLRENLFALNAKKDKTKNNQQ